MSVHKTRRRLSREARREQILQAALDVFVRQGYHGTHVQDVVEAAGVARGTFYLHFESKHAVFATLVDRMTTVFLEARPEEPDPSLHTRDDVATMLRRRYRAVLSTFRRHRRLCRLWLEEAVGVDKGFAARLEAFAQGWRNRIGERLDLMAEAGFLRDDLDRDLVTEMVIGMVERVVRRHVLPDPEPDLDHLAETLVAVELGGLVPPA
jgi:AcrR family transcriptional regulator